VALNALQSAKVPHNFLGINQKKVSILNKGNAYGHVILRGGNSQPNFDAVNVKLVEEKIKRCQFTTEKS